VALASAALLTFNAGAQSGSPTNPEQSSSTESEVPSSPALVLVPGVTGSTLVDPGRGSVVWGTGSRVFFPKDRGHSLALAIPLSESRSDELEAGEVLLELDLLGYSKPIYGPLVEALSGHGYRRGRLADPSPQSNLYLFAYDWRQPNLNSVRELDAQLQRIAIARGNPSIDLLCQSNAGLICRYLVRYGARSFAEARALERSTDSPDAQSEPQLPPTYRIERLLLVGTSNGGSLRQLHELDRGRRYVPGVGRFIGPEVLFTLRPLFDDLPRYTDDLFFDREGNRLEVDLFDASTWQHYGWSIFAPSVARRLSSKADQSTFGSVDDRLQYLDRRLSDARQLHDLLHANSSRPLQTHYYLLENESQPTPVRALLEQADGAWALSFSEDPALARSAALSSLASQSGDGHAALESQRYLSPDEMRALRGSAQISGGHFQSIVAPETHRLILGFLSARAP
jgi:hypothetical protein